MSMRRLGAVVLGFALALGACSPGAEDADVPDATPSLARKAPPEWDVPEQVPSIAPDGTKWVCNEVVDVCSEWSEGMDPIRSGFPLDPRVTERLADRRLTREEYEASFLDYKACLESFDIGVHVWSMTTPTITYATDTVGADFGSERYRASVFCDETLWMSIVTHWQEFEQPGPFVKEDAERVWSCAKELGLVPVVDPVPDDWRGQAFARNDILLQLEAAVADGVLSRTKVDGCVDPMPSILEAEKQRREKQSEEPVVTQTENSWSVGG